MKTIETKTNGSSEDRNFRYRRAPVREILLMIMGVKGDECMLCYSQRGWKYFLQPPQSGQQPAHVPHWRQAGWTVLFLALHCGHVCGPNLSPSVPSRIRETDDIMSNTPKGTKVWLVLLTFVNGAASMMSDFEWILADAVQL